MGRGCIIYRIQCKHKREEWYVKEQKMEIIVKEYNSKVALDQEMYDPKQ